MELLKRIPGFGVIAWVFQALTSPLGIMLSIAIASFALGHNVADSSAKIEKMKSEVAAMKIDLTVARQAEALAERQELSLSELTKSNQRKINDLNNDLRKRVAGPGLSRADAERLRNIR